nr:glycosyl hydrolase-related protein [Streptomyces sp. HNM0575]
MPGRHTFRVALRPYGGSGSTAGLYRTAEEFALPLLTHAVQGALPGGPARSAPPLGLGAEPAEAVVTAVKSAEDGDGIVVRLFNSGGTPVTATLAPAFPVASAGSCDLEENALQQLEIQHDGTLRLPLPGGRITTLRLRPAAPTARRR